MIDGEKRSIVSKGLRSMMKQELPILISFVAVLAIASIQCSDKRLASACSCTGPRPPLASLEQSDAVFSGMLTDLETTDGQYPHRVATFDVHTVWKGFSRDSVNVTTGMGGADCGYSFDEGEFYLVYAYGDPNNLDTDYCGRTKPLDKAETDLVALGQGDTIFATEEATIVPRSAFWISPIAIISVLGIAGAVVATILLMKRKHAK